MEYGGYPELSSVQKILVIKLRQLGDVLLTTPVFEVLKKRFPKAEIDAYVYSEASPLLEGNPFIHSVIVYDRSWKSLSLLKRIQKELAIWKKTRKKKYDLVINLTEGDRGAIAAKVSKANIRVGFQPKGKAQNKLYTHIVKNCPTLRHTVERNLDVLRRIGIFPEEEEKSLFLHVDEVHQKKVETWAPDPYVLIHPTSRWRFKCLPTKTVRALTEELIKRGVKVVFSSGPDPIEVKMVEEIVEGLDVINLAGKLSLQELSALILKSDLLICVDSLPLHIASALKKRVLAIFGPTSEITWGPWKNPHARVAFKKWSCRPCYLDGCGGSKKSECLLQFSLEDLLSELKIFPEVSSSRLRIFDQIMRGAAEEHPSFLY